MLIIFLLFFLVFSLVLLFVNASAFFGFLFTRVPFVPTSKRDVEFIVEKLNIGPEDTFYDLGSGDGKVVFIVNKITGAYCVGFELTSWTHILAQIKRSIKKVKTRVKFKNKNFFKENWGEASFVYGYLYPPLMRQVEEKFLTECKMGSVAIIRDFPFPNLKPEKIYYRPGRHEIYVYRKGNPVDNIIL